MLIWRDQFHLDSHADFASTWLYSKIFYHWIKNSDSLTSKYSELLVSHHGDLSLKGHLYLYPSWATFDSRVLSSWSRSMRCTPTSHLYIIPVSPHLLITRITNTYDTQRSTLDKYYHLNNSISFSRELILRIKWYILLYRLE